jgi:hypothetical protein
MPAPLLLLLLPPPSSRLTVMLGRFRPVALSDF